MSQPAANHLLDLFRSHAREDGACLMELPDGGRVTYGQAEREAARYAGALIGLGVQPGDRVAVQVEKSAAVVFLYLGCLRAGAIFLPLNTAYTPAEIDYFLADAEPAVFVCDPGKLEALARIAQARGVGAVVTLGADGEGSLAEAARKAPDRFDALEQPAEAIAVILYTSGTTGRSKGAMLTHGNLGSNALTLAESWRFTRDDVLIHALPVFHAHGLFVALNVTLVAGSRMIFLPRFDPEQVLRLMARATVFMGVPTYYTRLLAHPDLSPQTTRGMRLFVSGSAPLLAETHREWQGRTGHVILERYGMTETSMNTSNPYDGERIAGTVGFPLPGIEIRIADPGTGAPLPTGQIGGIEVKGPNVFSGYWRMPEKTASEFRPDGFFITGDLGTVDERGYIRIVGRSKDLIISGGYNVYPKEVEAEIDSIPGVLESAVFGVKHPDFGEAVTAAIVCKEGERLAERDVLAAIEGRLARYKLPKRVVFLDELPRNTMGKVQKSTLRERYGT